MTSPISASQDGSTPPDPDTRVAAREYIDEGRCVVPTPKGSKAPVVTGWQHLRIKKGEVEKYFLTDSNIGLLLGEPSGGLTDIDLDSKEAVLLAPTFLPPTKRIHGRPTNPRSHYAYIAVGAKYRKFIDPTLPKKKATIVEIRSTGQQTLVPPSAHPTGEQLFWEPKGEPAVLSPTELEAAVRKLASASLLARHWPGQGVRDDAACALAGILLRAGWDDDQVDEFVCQAARVGGDEEWEKRRKASGARKRLQAGENVYGRPKASELFGSEVITAVCKWLHLGPTAPRGSHDSKTEGPAHQFSLTDLGNAERFAAQHGHLVRYVHGRGWHVFDGKRWVLDVTRQVERLAAATIRSMRVEAESLDEGPRRDLIKHSLASERSERIDALLRRARAIKAVAITAAELDRNTHLLNVENGTIDLRTGKLSPHDRSQLITKLAPVHFDPDANCPVFEAFIQWALKERPQLIEFTQRATGYFLTGSVGEQAWFFFYGGGQNGKTTFVEAILDILGDYGVQAMPNVFVGKASHATEIAFLAGSRLAVVSEPELGKGFRDGVLKAATGDAAMTARFTHQDCFTFPITFKMVVIANHLPAVRDASEGFWRRVRLVPFENRISDELKDPGLKQKLKAEATGILAWAVRGAVRWYAEGLGTAPEVVAATKEYRDNEDLVRRFVEEVCELAPDARVTSGVVFKAYQEWSKSSGETALPRNEFSQQLLRTDGVAAAKVKKARGFVGIRLRVEPGDAGTQGDTPNGISPQPFLQGEKLK